jgi:hypothetical protein
MPLLGRLMCSQLPSERPYSSKRRQVGCCGQTRLRPCCRFWDSPWIPLPGYPRPPGQLPVSHRQWFVTSLISSVSQHTCLLHCFALALLSSTMAVLRLLTPPPLLHALLALLPCSLLLDPPPPTHTHARHCPAAPPASVTATYELTAMICHIMDEDESDSTPVAGAATPGGGGGLAVSPGKAAGGASSSASQQVGFSMGGGTTPGDEGGLVVSPGKAAGGSSSCSASQQVGCKVEWGWGGTPGGGEGAGGVTRQGSERSCSSSSSR